MSPPMPREPADTGAVKEMAGVRPCPFLWEFENRPVKVELPDGSLNTISYDGIGRRRRYEDSAGLRNFLWARAT
jgi:hypothetical protein